MTTGPFGKNENDLNRVSPFNAGHTDFRRRTRQFQDKQEAQRQRGGGGGGGRFSNIFKPSNEGFDRIRLIPGAYEVEVGNPNGTIDKMVLEYFPFVEHYHSGLEKGGVCSGGPLYFLKLSEDPSKPGRAPCKGCDRFFSDMVVNPETGKKKKGPMSRSNKTAFTVLHYHPYHKTESTDRDGKVRKNEETGDPCRGPSRSTARRSTTGSPARVAVAPSARRRRRRSRCTGCTGPSRARTSTS